MKLSYNLKIKTLQLNIPLKLKFKNIKKFQDPRLLKLKMKNLKLGNF